MEEEHVATSLHRYTHRCLCCLRTSVVAICAFSRATSTRADVSRMKDRDEDSKLHEQAHMRENISMQFSAATGQMSVESTRASLWAAGRIRMRRTAACPADQRSRTAIVMWRRVQGRHRKGTLQKSDYASGASDWKRRKHGRGRGRKGKRMQRRASRTDRHSNPRASACFHPCRACKCVRVSMRTIEVAVRRSVEAGCKLVQRRAVAAAAARSEGAQARARGSKQ